jgi:hypothetical protein
MKWIQIDKEGMENGVGKKKIQINTYLKRHLSMPFY